MKQKLLAELTTKFEGVSEAILDRIAGKLAKTVTTEEQVATAIAGVTFQSIIEAESDRRATEATQSAVKNYESKYGLKDGKKVEDGGEPQPKPQPKADEMPDWAKSLVEANKQMQSELNAYKTAQTATARRAKLNEIVAVLPESLRKGYARTNIDTLSDDDFTTMLTDVKTEVDSAMAELSAKGARFGKPSVSGGQSSEQLTQAQIDRIQGKNNGNPDAPEGQPY